MPQPVGRRGWRLSAALVGLLAMVVAGWATKALDINGGHFFVVWLALAVGFVGIATVVLVPREGGASSPFVVPWSRPLVTVSIVRCAAVVALIAITACSPSWRNDNSAPVEISVAQDGTSDLTLWVSNQSYTDKNVDITVTLDGAVIVDRNFHVGDQHNWIEHRIRLDDGTHTINATTVVDGDSVELSEEFTIEANQQRYAALNYWHYVPTSPNDPSSDPPGFSFDIQNDPIGFA